MAQGTGGRKSALLIGINKYDSDAMPDLHGCVADVATTEAFLREAAGIADITKLTSPASAPGSLVPTLDNVHGAFQKLAREAAEGDFIYIHYSGHGTRLPTDFVAFKGKNVYDECLVLPAAGRRLDYLRDVEMAFLLKQITDKGATVTFVLDCCHSGGATRDGDDDVANGVRGSDNVPRGGFIERDPIGPAGELKTSWKPPAPGDPDRGAVVVQHWMTASVRVSFLAACRPSQKAQEVPRGAAVKQGLLTACLASVVNDKGVAGGGGVQQKLSCDVVYNLVAGRVKKHEHRNPASEQDAVFGGRRDRAFFGVEPAGRAPVLVRAVEELTETKVKVVLGAGAAHGVALSDEYAVYPAGSAFRDLTDYSAPLATCRVTLVYDFTASAMLEPSAAAAERVQAGCVAVGVRDILKKHVLKPRGVSVLPATGGEGPGPLDQTVQEVRDSVGRDNRLVRVADADDAFFAVRVQPGGDFVVSFKPGNSEATVEVGPAVGDLLARLAHLTIFYNLFNLPTDNPRQSTGLEVRRIGFLDEGEDPPPPQPFSLDNPPQMASLRPPPPPGDIDIVQGRSLGVEVRNTSYRALYVEILDLEPSWKVTRAYPRDGDAPMQLERNEGAYFFITAGMSDQVPGCKQPDTFDRILVLATPRDQLNFPVDILPELGGDEGVVAPPVFDGDDGNPGRSGRGVPQPAWCVRYLDMRVVEHEEPADD
ncbi:hypothetical protein RB595_003598 [Gaeumannomyces hyphopodioides]